MNPGGGAGWDEPPLDIQIPDDARELDRDVLAYHRELRAQRRRRWLRGLTGPVAGRGTLMPVLASILAVCLVAGAMLSVATFSPSTTGDQTRPLATATASAPSATPKTSPALATSAPAASATISAPAASATISAQATQTGSAQATAQASGTGRTTRSASPSASGTRSAATRVTATATP